MIISPQNTGIFFRKKRETETLNNSKQVKIKNISIK